MPQFILSIDQGTTGTTVGLIKKDGQALVKVNHEFKQYYPHPGWVEHDASEIWSTVEKGIQQVFEKSNISPQEVAAVGITNQRETIVLWDKRTGEPMHRALVWQCRRTTDFCEGLKGTPSEGMIKEKTGLVVDPYFSGSKIKWALENAELSSDQLNNLAVGTIDSFLVFRLTGGANHVTDVSNASRTQLMNIHQGKWDSQLLELFKIPEEILPQIRPSSGNFGETRSLDLLPDGLPISGIAGDQQAALFGQACFHEGEAKCTFGTGSFILMNTGAQALKSESGILTTVAWQLNDQSPLTYALEGGAFICGAAVQWLRDEMQFFKSSHEIEELAQRVDDSGGVEFVPAFAGLGAPYWDPRARGVISGLTRGSNRAHIARATLDAMALQNVEILQAMEKDLGQSLRDVKVDGGACANNFLMQLQANYLQAPIFRPKMIETTMAGAAFLAGLGVGFWKSLSEIKESLIIDKKFAPKICLEDRELRLQSWRQAIEKTHS